MSIHVVGQLSRNIYCPGDILTGAMRYSNVSDASQSIAWSSFQVYGLQIVDPSWITVNTPTMTGAEIGTQEQGQQALAMQRGQGLGSLLPKLDPLKGRFLFSTDQSLLLCDIVLAPANHTTGT